MGSPLRCWAAHPHSSQRHIFQQRVKVVLSLSDWMRAALLALYLTSNEIAYLAVSYMARALFVAALTYASPGFLGEWSLRVRISIATMCTLIKSSFNKCTGLKRIHFS